VWAETRMVKGLTGGTSHNDITGFEQTTTTSFRILPNSSFIVTFLLDFYCITYAVEEVSLNKGREKIKTIETKSKEVVE
jgi:hypothetical protein